MRPTLSLPHLVPLAGLLLMVAPWSASANGGGILRPTLPAAGCSSCHSGGTVPEVQILVGDGDGVARGASVPVRVRVQAVNGQRGGFNLLVSDGLLHSNGAVQVADAAALNPGLEATHAGSSGPGEDPAFVDFVMEWTAPATEGVTVDFEAYGVSTPGGQSGAAGHVTQAVTIRCPRYWPDLDGDGYGAGDFTETCDAPPADTVMVAGDCDDSNSAIHPDAYEVCNGVDENCNGQIDEIDFSAPALCSGTDICSNGTCQPPPTLDGGTDAGTDAGTDPGTDGGGTPDGGGGSDAGGGDHISIAYADCSAAGVGAIPLSLLLFALFGLRRRARS